jgi:AraC-like DNA-binding protein
VLYSSLRKQISHTQGTLRRTIPNHFPAAASGKVRDLSGRINSGLPPRPPTSRLPESSQKVGETIRYMLQHLNRQLQVAKLAALVHVSPSHFFALFKRQTGCAPIDFFIRLRMQHACRLLDSTSLNVKEVAAVLGYDDPFYFSRTFKAVNRVSPSEYRFLPGERKAGLRAGTLPSALLFSDPAKSGSADAVAAAGPNGHGSGLGVRTTSVSPPSLRGEPATNGAALPGGLPVALLPKEGFEPSKRNG